jgi:hypothetical protein
MYSEEYFGIAKQLIDPFMVQTVPVIQTIVLIAVYFMTSFKLSACYSYVGVGLRLAQRMGLHRKLEYSFPPIEREMRKRAFWSLYQFDRYVSTILGLPFAIRDEDIDQVLPDELHDDLLSDEPLRGKVAKKGPSIMSGINAYTKIVRILGRITQKLYPLSPSTRVNSGHSLVSLQTVKQLEEEIAEWVSNLPEHLHWPPEEAYRG